MTATHADALATARLRLADELTAIARLSAMGRTESAEMQIARRAAQHYRSLIARLEAKPAAGPVRIHCTHCHAVTPQPREQAACPVCRCPRIYVERLR